MRATKAILFILLLLCCGLTVSSTLFWVRLDRLQSNQANRPTPVVDTATSSSRTMPSPAVAADSPELAPYMGELQRLTHKLQLALAAENVPLAKFYLYESREAVQELSHAVPEYRGHAIAILIGRTLEPAYAAVERDLQRKESGARLRASFGKVADACNLCHHLTNHAFLRVAEASSERNPYLQIFELQEEHVAQQNH